jgi:hypothetical protein
MKQFLLSLLLGILVAGNSPPRFEARAAENGKPRQARLPHGPALNLQWLVVQLSVTEMGKSASAFEPPKAKSPPPASAADRLFRSPANRLDLGRG